MKLNWVSNSNYAKDVDQYPTFFPTFLLLDHYEENFWIISKEFQ